jgi:hypothetical protein
MPNLHGFKPCAQNQEPRYIGGGVLKSWALGKQMVSTLKLMEYSGEIHSPE